MDVDLLVLTHTDEDHLDGLAQIIAARRVNAAFQFETYGPSPAAP